MVKPSTTSGRRERGAALVEFALVVPLLALFLFGIVQFGIAYDNKQSLNSAAREAGRFASLSTSGLVDIEDRARRSFIGAGSGSVAVEVRQPRTATATSDPTARPCQSPTGDRVVAVTVTLQHPLEIPFWGRVVIPMRSVAEFRCE